MRDSSGQLIITPVMHTMSSMSIMPKKINPLMVVASGKSEIKKYSVMQKAVSERIRLKILIIPDNLC
jgi:hypothetical protein